MMEAMQEYGAQGWRYMTHELVDSGKAELLFERAVEGKEEGGDRLLLTGEELVRNTRLLVERLELSGLVGKYRTFLDGVMCTFAQCAQYMGDDAKPAILHLRDEWAKMDPVVSYQVRTAPEPKGPERQPGDTDNVRQLLLIGHYRAFVETLMNVLEAKPESLAVDPPPTAEQLRVEWVRIDTYMGCLKANPDPPADAQPVVG